MKKRRDSGILVKTAVFAFAVFAVISIVQLQLEFNEQKAERDRLNAEVEALKDQKEQLENEYASLGDADHVVDVAKDKLNLRLPEEIIFYNDLYN